ncbi:MAG: DUF1343 domain-containing protein, partial [Verrucomicrobiota bacterium]|nr:DUF1343 domain-containing protein [Verrucomicrobiota bacterium]
VEFCHVSVGRGTDRPFEFIGAPYVDDARLAAELNAAALPAVRFIPVRFTPAGSVFKGQECRGVQIIVTDRDSVSAVDIGIILARTLHLLHPGELKIERMQKLLVHPPTLEGIRSGKSLESIKTIWLSGREGFRERRERFLLYR